MRRYPQTELKATLRGSDALLTWETAQEQNNFGFQVERSPDGKRFELLGFVAGRGNATTANAYQYADQQLEPDEDFYYRLRQLDNDGKATCSPIVTVRTTGKAGALATLHPVPAHDQVYLTFLDKPAQVTLTLFGTDGRKLLQRHLSNPGAAPLALPIAQLPAGAYVVQLTDGHTVETHRLLKQ